MLETGTRVVAEAGTSKSKTETEVAETKTEASKLGLAADLETEAGSRDLHPWFQQLKNA